MKRPLLFSLFFISLALCFDKSQSTHIDTLIVKSTDTITSIALSGNNYYAFYRITKENKLITLGHGYEDNANDSTQYERTVRQILNEHK